MIIYELEIPQLYTAVGRRIENPTVGLYSMTQEQYMCIACNQLFAAGWEDFAGGYGTTRRGKAYFCPHCGTAHYADSRTSINDGPIPIAVRFTIETFKRVVRFSATYKTIEFPRLFVPWKRHYKESFRFDLAKQQVLHRSPITDVEENAYVGNPFEDLAARSLLRHINVTSMAKSHKAKIVEMLSSLRKVIQERMPGSAKQSMYVPYGQSFGYVLAPIENIAYRVTYPDAPNLDKAYRGYLRERKEYQNRYLLGERHSNKVMFDRVAEKMRVEKLDFRTAMVQCSGLPNKKSVRDAIGESPFGVEYLRLALSLCEKHDYAMRLYKAFENGKVLSASEGYEKAFCNAGIVDFLKTIKSIYGEKGMVYAAENQVKMQILDCRQLYAVLNEENRATVIEGKVPLPDLHDWMARQHRRQSHKNIVFEVPEHIERRLAMQKDHIKFFLPRESFELLDIGEALKNCVASYAHRVADGTSNIVGMSDDRGLLIACIQIKEDSVVQAKLRYNKPVWENMAVNNEIVEWAKTAKLQINTNDIRIKKKEEKKERVS